MSASSQTLARAVLTAALVVAAIGAAALAGHRAAPPAAPAMVRVPPRPVAPPRALAAVPAPPAKAVVTPPAPSPTPPRYVIKRVLDIDGPIRYGTWYWDEAGVPGGPVVVTVDLAANVLSIFRDGYEIGTTAVIYGIEGKDTPLGIFPITQKDAHHVSSIYRGAPMPYMLRLTNDGISIHGSEVAIDAATHGCIGVPKDFARKLFGAVKLGDKVIITRGEKLATGKAVNAA